MSTESLNFSDLGDNIPVITEKISKTPSHLLDYRLVSWAWHNQCEWFLEHLWIDLQKNPPQGVVDILPKMSQIDIDNDSETYFLKFKKLAYVFKKLPMFSLPIRINDFQLLQNEYDIALQTIWGRLRNALVQLFSHLPPVDAEASVIRSFLNDSNNYATLTRVKVLNLEKCNLKVVPLEIDRLSGLEILDLSNNQLTRVHNFDLPNLIRLILTKNNLIQVPSFSLSLLEVLDLRKNKLIEVPNFNMPNLKALALGYNNLTQLPNFKLPKLELFNINNNNLTEILNFTYMESLTMLAIGHNKLKKILPGFTHMPNLTCLYLDDNMGNWVPNFAHLPNLTLCFHD